VSSTISEFFRSRVRSFRYAFSGWWFVIRTQKNAWIHAVISVIVIVLALWLQVSLQDMAVLVLTIAVVWTAEFLNTAVEAVVDLASPQIHPLAKIGKDVGAAAVLIAALASIIIGLLIMGPALLVRLQGLFLPH
jgi:diacylglycerol kinase